MNFIPQLIGIHMLHPAFFSLADHFGRASGCRTEDRRMSKHHEHQLGQSRPSHPPRSAARCFDLRSSVRRSLEDVLSFQPCFCFGWSRKKIETIHFQQSHHPPFKQNHDGHQSAIHMGIFHDVYDHCG